MSTDREIMEALLRGERVIASFVSLRLGEDGILESTVEIHEDDWLKRPHILSEGPDSLYRYRVIKEDK